MQVLRKDDVLVITRLDRLGRSAKDLLTIAAELESRGVDLIVLEQAITTKSPEGRLFFQMVAAFSEFEHAIMAARTKDGLAAARARGRLGGRKPKLTNAQILTIKKLYDEKNLSVIDIAAQFSVTRPTIYRALENLKLQGAVQN
jgi:DNA invertase Pin-like site-specific DNA recombinase